MPKNYATSSARLPIRRNALIATLFLLGSSSHSSAELFTYIYEGQPYGIEVSEDHPYEPDMRLTAELILELGDASNLRGVITSSLTSSPGNPVSARLDRTGSGPVFDVTRLDSSVDDGIQAWDAFTFPYTRFQAQYATSFTTDAFGNIDSWGFSYDLGSDALSQGEIEPPRFAGTGNFGGDLSAYQEILGPPRLFQTSESLVDDAYLYRSFNVREHYPWSRAIIPGDSVVPYVITFDDEKDFDGVFGKKKTLLTPKRSVFMGENQIGTVDRADGQSTVTRADGTTFLIQDGTPIFKDDRIETYDNGDVNIVFIDGTNFGITDNSVLKIDEYAFDTDDSDGTSDTSIIRQIVTFTSSLIGRDEPDASAEGIVGTIGIRGSADDIEIIDPNTGKPVEFGDGTKIADLDTNAVFEAGSSSTSIASLSLASAALTTASTPGSPITLYTAIDVPENRFALTVDFAFFDDPEATIEVMFGDAVIGTIRAEDYELGEYGIAEFLLSNADETEIAELAFTYNGEAGSQALFDNVAITAEGYAGVPNGDFEQFDNGWFTRGDGQVLLGASTFSVVPEPSSAWIAALLAFGYFAKKRARRALPRLALSVTLTRR